MKNERYPGEAEEYAERIKAKFAAIKRVLDQLEPAAHQTGNIDPLAVALSQAVSLKRIADALEPTIEREAASPERINELLGELNAKADLADYEKYDDIESLAGDMLNFTTEEVQRIASHKEASHGLTLNIRRLASAVLRKASK